MTGKERLHQLVEELPEGETSAAERYLEFLRERAALPRSLAEAPFDEEPVTAEDLAAIAESRAQLAAGQGVSHTEARRLLLGA